MTATTRQLTCLVTGAGRGIGRAVARALSAAGHRVALTARSEDELESVAAGLPGPSLVIPGDITDPETVERVFLAVEEQWGPVEVLVANAGVARSARLEDTSDELWEEHLRVNLTAPFRCVRRAVPAMREQGYGRVVVIASVAAKAAGPYITAYAAAKHGVLGLVRSAAAETAGSGVTVNALCPGFVDTRIVAEAAAGIARATRSTTDEARLKLARLQPLERLLAPEEVADLALAVIASEAMNGQGIVLDGGGVQS